MRTDETLPPTFLSLQIAQSAQEMAWHGQAYHFKTDLKGHWQTLQKKDIGKHGSFVEIKDNGGHEKEGGQIGNRR